MQSMKHAAENDQGDDQREEHLHKRKRLRPALLAAAAAFLLFSIIIPARAEGTDDEKHVLFLNSYGYDFETVPIVVKEVAKKLNGVASVQYLFMNEKYVSDETACANTVAELDAMTSEFRYDAVILGDDAAFDFAIRYRDRYFRDIPLIYEDINSVEKAEKYKDDPLITGVVEFFPMKGTIELARSIQKNATRVVVITDNSVSGAGSASQAMAEQADFPDLEFELLDTSALTADEIREKVSLYRDDTILLYTVFNVDGSGIRYTLSQGVKLITDAARIPVFKADEAGLGSGLVGGYMLSYQSIGQETADLVLTALSGGEFAGESYKIGTALYEFDQKVLDRYQILKSSLPANSEYINTTPDFFEANERAIIIALCGAGALVIVSLLISESRKKKLSRELELEERSNRAKTEFISRMSHDIRTPLNVIIGMDRFALNEADHPDKVREYLGKAVSSGELLTSLVNDILDISKIESGNMKLNPSPYSLKEFFDHIHSVFNGLCAEKGITLEVTEDAGALTVQADHVRLNQLFYNLLTNAVKFTDRGGRISFALHGVKQDGILRCVFTVADTGCGMSPEFQKHMFEQFSQEGRKDIQGSGLGLAIVRSITDLMGGRIQVESAPGAGSTFTVDLDLPIAESNEIAGETGEESPADYSELRGRHVLLAEDNEINAQITEMMLQAVGVSMDLARNGALAVKIFSEAPSGYYFLILMDNRMPGKTGTEAAREIRGLSVPGAATIPIIALTADAFDDDHQKFMESGMNDCLTKPLDPEKLISMLMKYC